jgi:murein DD-endopeptidase MepM/ murein hydrolase activator NlpD
VPVNTGGNYIDNSDDYNLGATPAPQAPSAIQFSQRGSQCQTVVRPGGGTAGQICGDTGNGPVASGAAGVAGVGNPGGDAPIRLGSLGAGAQLPDAPFAVRIGPLNLSSQGLSINGHYYFRTSRPNAVQGNGDRGFLFPLTVPSPISSIFGWRRHPILGTTRFHAGTDMSAPLGTPVVAAMSGDVAIANFMGGYGLSVVLSHADGDRKTLYAHLSEIFVKPGETVKQGEVIGRVGSTGLSTGPHLHFEVRELTPEGWVARNPEAFLGQAGPATALLDADPSLNGTLAMLIEAIKAAYLEQYRDAQLQAKR